MSIRITGHVIEYDGYRVGIISPNVPTTVLDEFIEQIEQEPVKEHECRKELEDIQRAVEHLYSLFGLEL